MNKSKVAYLLSQAQEHLETGQRDEALELIREALREDPGEITITEVILSMERHGKDISGMTGISLERNQAGSMDPKLEKAFRLSDEAYSQGNEARALAYLKKAVSLFPDQPEAESRLAALKVRIRASNLVKIGLKKLSEGDTLKAVAASRKAFDLLPDAPGLEDLLAGIEKGSNPAPPASNPVPEQDTAVEELSDDSKDVPASGAMLWADRIRAAVKEDRFEEAGKMVAEAVDNYPDDPLLISFYTKLKRLGFVS